MYIYIYIHIHIPFYQWPFQEPKLEVPAIDKAYVMGYIPKIWQEIWYERTSIDPGIPIQLHTIITSH